MSPGGQSNLLLIRRLLHPSTPGFDHIRGRFFAQVLPKFSSTARITMDVYAARSSASKHSDRSPRFGPRPHAQALVAISGLDNLPVPLPDRNNKRHMLRRVDGLAAGFEIGRSTMLSTPGVDTSTALCLPFISISLIRISLWLDDKQLAPMDAWSTRREPSRDMQAQRPPAQIVQTKSVWCSRANAAPPRRGHLR
jgi:hypothetical protein